MARRRWRIQRPMLVPATWQGSVEHFYHFLLGYFVPLVRWQERTGATEFSVRDCGPMNPWFELLRPGTDVDFMTASWMLQRYLTRKQEYRVFHQWDDPRRFHKRTLRRVADAVLSRIPSQESSGSTRNITVIERRASPDFYLTGSSDAYASGSDWRSVPNIQDVADQLPEIGQVRLVDTAAMSPLEQVQLLSQTDVLVGQHGAGLANMIWMKPGSIVIEIQPPLIAPIDRIFSSLAGAMSLDHLIVPQPHDHSPMDFELVRKAIAKVQKCPGQFVPQLPGRQPLRAMRQLPRRN